MPHLYPNLRISQIFGGISVQHFDHLGYADETANTEVGKTLLTTALIRATASRYAGETPASGSNTLPAKRVFYLKPVSTGPDSESDVSYVDRNAGRHTALISTHNLYQYREPMSPHLAAKLAPDLPFPASNDELVQSISRYTTKVVKDLAGGKGALYVETAGGVHSPALHPPHTQSTFLRSLRLPAILIASPHLGGISTTITSYESLLLRGYSISAVLCLRQPYYQNHEFLTEYFADRGIPLYTVNAPPEKYGTVEEDRIRLGKWYEEVESISEGGVAETVSWLEREHEERIGTLGGMAERTLDSVWWPFTQHGIVNKKEDVMVVDSAFGDQFDAHYTKPKSTGGESLLEPYFDGSASWFTQSHGHAAEALTLAAAKAAGRYGHVLFPSGTHQPALELAEKLKETVGDGWADRVFFSDNGSTGIEVALKMALRATGRRYGWDGDVGGEVGVIGLRGGYHGDTIGSMDASEASTFNKAVDWYKGRGYWFSPPMIQYTDGKPTVHTTGPDLWPHLPPSLSAKVVGDGWSVPFDSLQSIYSLSDRLKSDLAEYYRYHIRSHLLRLVREGGRRFGGLVIEPVCLGAGGMVFVDPLFQACMIEVVRASGDLFGGRHWDGSSYETELQRLPLRDPNSWQGLPIIFDEVFSGLHRFGYHSAASVLNHTPDIAVYAKILTGGLLPMSTTLASSSIFNAFLSDKKVDALLHGHSYTANPVGCSVALESIKMVERHLAAGGFQQEKEAWGVGHLGEEGRWSFWSAEFIERVSHYPTIKGSMAMGTVLAIELEDKEADYGSLVGRDFLEALKKETVQVQGGEEFQIHSRPLGNVIYVMTSLFTKPAVVRAMEEVIEKRIKVAEGQGDA